jgi:hypothetical protein
VGQFAQPEKARSFFTPAFAGMTVLAALPNPASMKIPLGLWFRMRDHTKIGRQTCHQLA